jgi:hypothetical protein
MANDNTTRTRDADVERDFETGTVNPDPGMAPPHRADDLPAGSMTGTGQAAGGCPTGLRESDAAENARSKSGSGGCGCG